ncbi:hypothetical protein ACEQ8H_005024 [Pleosporales sp. CAS-2024a]
MYDFGANSHDHIQGYSEAEWAQLFVAPNFWKKIESEFGFIPGWLVAIYHQIERKASERKARKLHPADNKWWIVQDNFTAKGIRSRKREPDFEYNPFGDIIMAPQTKEQNQRHSLLLMTRLLCIRNNVSPFTLVLDDLNQRAMPLIDEMMRRGLSRNLHVIVVSFEATQYDAAIINLPAYAAISGKQLMQDVRAQLDLAKESLVVVDSLSDFLQVDGADMNELLDLVANQYKSTLVGVYHQDMLPAQEAQYAYAPQPLELLQYMATCVMHCRSFAHALAIKAAKERSLAEPTFGLLQSAEGVVQCLDANSCAGMVLDVEFRRKSGRPHVESYFLREAEATDYLAPAAGLAVGKLKAEFVTVLDWVPAYNAPVVTDMINGAADRIESTFNLDLTERQKQAREGVVLPYLDAQKAEGGEGGRILYDMGSEDDFDEEEDEI